MTSAMKVRKGTIAAAVVILSAILPHPGHADWVNRAVAYYGSSGFPPDAVVGGKDAGGEALYICRGVWGNSSSKQPGWTHRNDTVCHFSYGGQDYAATNYDFWILSWALSNLSGDPPASAIPFGWEHLPPPALGGLQRYPCRVTYASEDRTGEYAHDLGGCLLPYGGRAEVESNGVSIVLTDPDGNPGTFTGAAGTLIGPFMAKRVVSGQIPYDAVVGGVDTDKATLYFCSAEYPTASGRQHAGKTKASWNACSVGDRGLEQFVANYLVLTPDWTPEAGNNFGCQQGSSPCTATRPILAGNDTDGQPLYLCRGSIDASGAVYPGKIARSFTGGCSISANGQEHYVANYELLTDGLMPPPPVVR